jgi:hypothetical protein
MVCRNAFNPNNSETGSIEPQLEAKVGLRVSIRRQPTNRILDSDRLIKYLSGAKNVAGVLPVGILILFSLSAAASSTSSSSSTSSQAANQSNEANSYAQCLREVPYNVTIKEYSNYTSGGFAAIFPNGTEVLFPYASCVRPLHPNDYSIVLAIGSNPEFIAAENGSLYSFEGGIPTDQVGNTVNGTSTCRYASITIFTTGGSNQSGPAESVECKSSSYLNFFLYNGQMLKGCDGPYADFDGWLQVGVFYNSTGGVDTSNIEAQQNGAFGGEFLCVLTTTLPVISSQSNRTLTLNSTVTLTVTVNGTITTFTTFTSPTEITATTLTSPTEILVQQTSQLAGGPLYSVVIVAVVATAVCVAAVYQSVMTRRPDMD